MTGQGPGRTETVLDWLKPHRTVAIARMRKNGFALVAALIVTQLAPVVPSPWMCLWLLLSDGRGMNTIIRWMCWAEIALFSILSLNIAQAYLGIRYPPPPCNSVDSPARRALLKTPPAVQPIQSFSSLNRSLASSTYAQSPNVTPSRLPSYKTPLSLSTSSTSSPFKQSLNSSLSNSLMASPLGYRSRPTSSFSARSLRSSVLSQFEADDDDEF